MFRAGLRIARCTAAARITGADFFGCGGSSATDTTTTTTTTPSTNMSTPSQPPKPSLNPVDSDASPAVVGGTSVAPLPDMPPAGAPLIWATRPEFDDIDPDIQKYVRNDVFLQPLPEQFLSPRVVMTVEPAEQLLSECKGEVEAAYVGVDVRNPASTPALNYVGMKKSLTRSDQVRTVAEFISGHLAHQSTLPEWQRVFDLVHMDMDVSFYIYIVQLQIISRRMATIRLDRFSRRREVVSEMHYLLRAAFATTSEKVTGRALLDAHKTRFVAACGEIGMVLSEALMYDGPGADLRLLTAIMHTIPLPRAEDLPMYTYYTLVHYIRFHVALFDRMSDEEVSKGNFHFIPPTDHRIFKTYSDVELDSVARSWTVGEAAASNTNGEH